MEEAGRETVDFAALVRRTAEESYVSLKELVEKSNTSEISSDSEKKIMILKYIVKTQQRFLRLNILSKWCQQVPLIQYCQQLGSTLSSHDTCFTQAADSMFFMHEGLQQARAPIYDVPSAIEILLSGTYQRLPKCIEDVGTQNTLTEDQQGPALRKLDTLVRSKLLDVSLPKELSRVSVSDGVVSLRADGEFEVLVTLGYRGHLSMWRILHLKLLIGERNGLLKVEESRRHALGDDLERRMSASETPFMTLYSILHEFCIALIMDTVIRQVQSLKQGRWKDAIRFELISDGTVASTYSTQDGESDVASLRTPGLKIFYWLDLDKNIGTFDAAPSPFLKIEPCPDMQMKCLHSTFLIDPVTGREAHFTLDCSCIDVEMLLLRAIKFNKYTRLLEMHKELEKSREMNRSPDDVKLQFCLGNYEAGQEASRVSFSSLFQDDQEILNVRAYGSSFFSLGINIRSGRFFIFSLKNIISSKVLMECEEALNQGTITAVKAFIKLRKSSILHLFSSIGKFLGLEVFEHGSMSMKFPKEISGDPESLFMGFPEDGNSFFLLMQLDNDFKPCAKLIEAKVDSSWKAERFGDMSKIIRVKNLDMHQMHMPRDEIESSLLEHQMGPSISHDIVTDHSERVLPYNRISEGSSGLSNFSDSFSSIVDEVFELDKGSSGQPTSSNYDLSSAKHFGSFARNSHGEKLSVYPSNREGTQISQNADQSSNKLVHSASSNSFTMPPLVKNETFKKLTASKSDQELAALRASPSVSLSSHGIMMTLLSYSSSKCNESKILSVVSGASVLDLSVTEKVLCQHGGTVRKRTASEMLKSLPSLPHLEASEPSSKRRKTVAVPHMKQQSPDRSLISGGHTIITRGKSFSDLIDEVNKGNGSSYVYVASLLQIIRHCSLCIKHARLTSQMENLGIPYAEEVGSRTVSSCLWLRLPFLRDNAWQCVCMRLGRPGNLHWEVKIIDAYYRHLWELQKGSNSTPWGFGVRIANTSNADCHIHYDSEGIVLSYTSVEDDSISKMVVDLQRLSNARSFALGMRKLLGARTDDKLDESNATPENKPLSGSKTGVEGSESYSEKMRRAFRIEAVGPMSLWFCFGSGVLARFVVEWQSGKEGCRVHVSPDQLWPHTKFLEDFINGGEVGSLLDCIRLTAGPLHALAAATRPARAAPISVVPGVSPSISSNQGGGAVPSNSDSNISQVSSGVASNTVLPTALVPTGNHMTGPVSAAGRGGPGIVPSSLLPIDVSVVLRGPYWIRIIYRRVFAIDMRCFAGDQVWLQPATPPKTGLHTGGSLPCPQFRPFIVEHVAQELNSLDTSFAGAQQASGVSNSTSNQSMAPHLPTAAVNRENLTNVATPRTGSAIAALNRIGNSLPGSSSSLPALNALRKSAASAVPSHVRGEVNTAIIGLGDDGGYGGGWVPLVTLKKVLRAILKYLGVLWLFAQLPDILNEILGSIFKEHEGALLNLDQEQPALRFFVGGYVFAVSVHRVQLLLQVLSIKRFHQSQQQQQNPGSAQEELTQSEIGEICDYFSRRVASEPYDASRVASFITLLTLPIPVLREFLKLIAWEKSLLLAQGQGVHAPAAGSGQKSRIELCLENHTGSENSSPSKSSIQYDRPHNSVDFALTVVLDPAHIPHVNVAGGAAWLPYCVSVRLRYSFGENPSISFLEMEGSHGGSACWLRPDEWDKCKQRVIRTVEVSGATSGAGDGNNANQGRLRIVADNVQRTLQVSLQGLRE
ncbi:hypothetical protein M569_02052, partial [Genlisea aurea]